jgi:integrase/recombinase XerD
MSEAPIPDVLTAAELDELLAVVTGRSKTALRTRALLRVAHDAALRSAEVVKLRPADVDLATGSVNVRKGKGGRSRLIRDCLDPATCEAVAAWLALRDTFGWDGRSAVLFGTFYTRPGRASGDNSAAKGGDPLDTSYLRRLLPKLAAKAKLTKDVSPHLLRHTRARDWSDRGVPVADIQAALGHRRLQTTAIYLARLAPAGMGASQHGRPMVTA